MAAAKELPFSLVLRADIGAGKAALREVQGGLDAVMGAATRAAGAILRSDTSLSGLSATGLRSSTALTGVTQASDGLTRGISAQAAEVVAANREHRAWQATLDQLRARFNPLFATSQAYERELRDIAEAERLGAISALEAAGARERASAIIAPMNGHLVQNARATNVANAANANLVAQWNDIAVMMAAGQNPLMLALQQGTQISQVLAGLGGGTSALRAIGASFVGMLNPISLATIGIIAFGAAGLQWLMSLRGETKTYEDTLEDLNETLDRMKGRFDLLGNTRLEERFGSLSGLVRTLNTDMLDLDRAAELKTLKATVEGFLTEDLAPSFGQKFRQFYLAAQSGLGSPNVLTDETLKGVNLDRLGGGISYADFSARQDEIVKLAGAGEVEQVIARVVALQEALAGGEPFTKMDEKLQVHLVTLAEWAQRTAEIEAFWNGSARQERITRETTELATASRQRAEIAQAEVAFGRNSVQVEEIRNRHAREALELRLEEMGVAADTADGQRVLVALAAEQAALARQRADEEARSGRRLITDLTNQADLSAAALQYGRDSVQVEALRAEQAREALRTRLREQGVAADLIEQAAGLLQLDQERVRALQEAERARDAADMLASLREEAAIGRAMVQFGRDSRQVKELEIEAERRQYALQLERMNLSQAQTREYMKQWEAARGLASADPFGNLAAARDMVRSQSERIDRLRLELALVGQSESQRSRLLALHRAELEIRRRGLDVSGQAAETLRSGAVEEDALRQRLDSLADAWGRVDDAAGSAIDKMVDALTGGDIEGALKEIGNEVFGFFMELGVKNPLKNLALRADLPTLEDLGGLGGIVGRLMGKGEVSPDLRLSTRNAAAMTVTTPLVTVNAGTITGLTGPLGGMPGIGPGLAGAEGVQRQIWDFFRGKGLEPHQVAAILGNVSAESGFNPRAVGDGGFAHGLFQWNDRAPDLLEFIGGRGNLGDVQKQLEFAWQELLTSENGVLNRLMASRNVYEANTAFIGFERPSGWTPANPQAGHGWDRRLGAAEAALAKFSKTTGAATADLGVLGQGFDLFGNALGDALNGLNTSGGGGGGMGGLITSLGNGLANGIGGLLGLPGFMVGGDTGGSDPTKIAGFVHQQEFVFDAPAVRRIGVQNLEAIRQGQPVKSRAADTRTVAAYAPAAASAQPPQITFAPVIQPVNNSSVPLKMEVRETEEAGGGRRMELVLSDQVGDALRRPGGARRSLRDGYGVRPVGVKR